MNFTHIVLIPKVNEPKHMCCLEFFLKFLLISWKLFYPMSYLTPRVLLFLVVWSLTIQLQLLSCYTGCVIKERGRWNRWQWNWISVRHMIKLNGEERWVILALETFQTTSYSALINGETHDFISHTHGIKQGDPLFLYLFLICAEGLSSLLRKAEENR